MPQATLLPLLILALLIVVLTLLYFWGRKSSFTLTDLRRLRRNPSTARTFIGRETEQQRFLELARDRKSSVDLLIVSGPKGAGKRTLLARFKERSLAEKTSIYCGPLLDLLEAQQIEDLMERVVRDLEDQAGRQNFSDFNAKLQKYHAAATGRKTGVDRGLVIARGAAAGAAGLAGAAGVPGATIAKSALESGAVGEALELAKDAISGPGDLRSLTEAFVSDLLQLGESQKPHRLVLLFDNLDARPNDHDIRWVRDKLIPRLVHDHSVLLVTTTEDPLQVAITQEIVRESIWLRPFDEAESRRYVKEVIGIENQRLLDEVTKRGGGLPQKLNYYRAYFEARPPEYRLQDQLSDEAEAWVVSGDVNQLLQQIKSDYLRKVIVASSPLRWFNAELLEAVAEKAGLPDKEETQTRPASLLELGRRPSWITQMGGGWGIEMEQRRRDFIEELRRFNRTLHKEVHELGAEYHHRRLVAFEAQAAAVDVSAARAKSDVFNYAPKSLPSKRFEDPEYTPTLAEWLYHILALAPEKAFPIVADIAGETLFYDFDNCRVAEPCNSERLLQIGPELNLPKRQRLYLDLLARAAFSLRQGDQQEAIRVLRALTSAGAPTPFLKPVILFLMGACHWQLVQEAEAVRCFEDADNLFSKVPPTDLRAIRVRCFNATWLAYSLTRRDQAAGRAQKMLTSAIADATNKLGDDALVGELERARALIHEELLELDGARTGYENALISYEKAGIPNGAALVRRDLSRLLLQQNADEEAGQELDKACAIYGYLADTENQAAVAVEKMKLYLKLKDTEKAEEQKTEALKLANDRAVVRNMVGNTYFAAEFFPEATEAYQEAVKRAPNIAVYRANLAGALLALDRPNDAIREIEEARRLLPNDQGLLLQHALLNKSTKNQTTADSLFDKIEHLRRKDVDDDPQRSERHASLGVLLLIREKYDEAEKAYREAVTLEVEEPSYRIQLGRSLYYLQRYEEAATEFLKAADLAPGRAYIGDWISSTVKGLEQELAISLLQEAVNRLPKDAQLHYQLGQLLRRPIAIHASSDKDELKPSSPATPEQSPVPVTGEGGAGAAPALGLENAPEPTADVELTPREKSLLPGRETGVSLASAIPNIRNLQTINLEPDLDKSQREEKAIQEFKAARKLKPDHVPCLLELAEIFVDRRDWDQADKYAAKASKLVGSDALDSTRQRLLNLLTRIQRKESWYREVGNLYPVVTPIAIELATNLERSVGETPEGKQFIEEMLSDLREALLKKTGVKFPGVRVRINSDLSPGDCVILIHEVPRYLYQLESEHVADASSEECLALNVTGKATTLPWNGKAATWIDSSDLETLEENEIAVWERRGFILATLGHILELHAADFVGIQEVQNMVEELASATGRDIKVTDQMLPRLSVVLRRLLQEKISIADLNAIIDDFLMAPPEADVIQVAERIRARLVQTTLQSQYSQNGALRVGELSPLFEKDFSLKGQIERNGRRSFLRMAPRDVQELLGLLRDKWKTAPDVKVLLVNDGSLRPYLRSLLELEFPDFQVYSRAELGTAVQLESAFVVDAPA
ncbi:MAG: FHIPEP family type III secretion protein [bacterium]